MIAATNRKNMLDEALLRPGRFDLKIYMGRPTAANRLKILQVPMPACWPLHADAGTRPGVHGLSTDSIGCTVQGGSCQ